MLLGVHHRMMWSHMDTVHMRSKYTAVEHPLWYVIQVHTEGRIVASQVAQVSARIWGQ